MSGPLKGIFQYLNQADPARWAPLLALFRVAGRSTSDAVREAESRRLPYVLLEQSRRFDASLIGQTRSAIMRHGVSLIQSHGYKTHILAWRMKRSLGLPWVGFVHGWTAETWRVRLYHALDSYLLRYADRVICVSQDLAGKLVERGVSAKRLVIVQNAVEHDEGVSECRRGALREVLGIGPDAPLVAVIGRFSHEKGQAVFLESFRRLATLRADAHAVLVGEGVDGDALKKRVRQLGLEKAVHFPGYQRRVAAVYRDSDLIVIPSVRPEGIPNVLLEAMSAGCPVIASSIGGIPEVARHEAEALLVSPNQPDTLADAMQRLLTDGALRERLVREARERVLARHSPTARAERIFDVYESLVG